MGLRVLARSWPVVLLVSGCLGSSPHAPTPTEPDPSPGPSDAGGVNGPGNPPPPAPPPPPTPNPAPPTPAERVVNRTLVARVSGVAPHEDPLPALGPALVRVPLEHDRSPIRLAYRIAWNATQPGEERLAIHAGADAPGGVAGSSPLVGTFDLRKHRGNTSVNLTLALEGQPVAAAVDLRVDVALGVAYDATLEAPERVTRFVNETRTIAIDGAHRVTLFGASVAEDAYSFLIPINPDARPLWIDVAVNWTSGQLLDRRVRLATREPLADAAEGEAPLVARFDLRPMAGQASAGFTLVPSNEPVAAAARTTFTIGTSIAYQD